MTPPPQESERVEGRLPDGHLLQNRYRVLGVRGVGGMSTVYKAQDLRFSKVTRLCVVKEMLNTATDPQVRAMIKRNFEREANILATLNHPGIVQVYDFFSEQDRSYLVLEFVFGPFLLGFLRGFLCRFRHDLYKPPVNALKCLIAYAPLPTQAPVRRPP